MRTAEELAEEYIDTNDTSSPDEVDIYNAYMQGFVDAEQLSDMDDEQPEEGTWILAKMSSSGYHAVYYTREKDLFIDGEMVKFWRQINHK